MGNTDWRAITKDQRCQDNKCKLIPLNVKILKKESKDKTQLYVEYIRNVKAKKVIIFMNKIVFIQKKL